MPISSERSYLLDDSARTRYATPSSSRWQVIERSVRSAGRGRNGMCASRGRTSSRTKIKYNHTFISWLSGTPTLQIPTSCGRIHIHFESTPRSNLLRDVTTWVAGMHSLPVCLRWDLDVFRKQPNIPVRPLLETHSDLVSLDIGWLAVTGTTHSPS